MANELRTYIIASLLLHAGLFCAVSLYPRRAERITIPVEVVFNSPAPAAPAPSVTAPAAPAPQEPPRAKPQEIAEPVKVKPLPKPEAKKPEEKKPEEKKQEEPLPPAPVETQPERPSPSPWGSRREGDAAAPRGASSSISVEAVRFPYTYYTGLVSKRVARYWQWASEFGRLKTVVYFRIRSDGTISDVRVETASGDDMFDQQAVLAVNRASPFPPLPQDYREPYLGVFFEFQFRE